MLKSIQNLSYQHLTEIFKPLDELKDYVFWIRNHDMSKQIYVNNNYNNVWQRDATILLELPLLWLDYLALENKNDFMKQLQARHELSYLDEIKNVVLYQIATPKGEKVYLLDRCYRCSDLHNENYIVGFSKVLTAELWHQYWLLPPLKLDDLCVVTYKLIFELLSREFSITRISKQEQQSKISKDNSLEVAHHYSLSKREMDCLNSICQGKTNKQAARVLLISPRTVESHLESIMRKTNCQNKIEIISRFSRYFYHKPD